MLAATIISDLNVREQAANAMLELSTSNKALHEYVQESRLFFTSETVEQRFMFRLIHIGQNMNDKLDEIERATDCQEVTELYLVRN